MGAVTKQKWIAIDVLVSSWYLAPTTSVRDADHDVIGLFETIGSLHNTALDEFRVWALDNGCFSGSWTEDRWRHMIAAYSPESRDRCLFCVVPDVVYDCDATLAQFTHYAPIVRDHGYPVALVTQDGLIPERVPWDEIDALFIGGSDTHKRGNEGMRLIVAGQNRGKWVHVGRVNSVYAIERLFWMADSWDGTTGAISPRNIRPIAAAVRRVRAKKERQLCFSW